MKLYSVRDEVAGKERSEKPASYLAPAVAIFGCYIIHLLQNLLRLALGAAESAPLWLFVQFSLESLRVAILFGGGLMGLVLVAKRRDSTKLAHIITGICFIGATATFLAALRTVVFILWL